MKHDITIYGKFIRQKCREQGITQTELARRCGFHSDTISKFVTGIHVISPEWVARIEQNLNVPEGTIENMLIRKEPEMAEHYASERELEILKAWNRGQNSPERVAEITGYSLKIVGKYLPLGKEGELKKLFRKKGG